MAKKTIIRLNTNDNHLSLGNMFRIIKEESIMKNTFLQSDLFCSIFQIDSIADSTVNNYCTGYRSINTIYKEHILSLKKEYQKDSLVFLPILSHVLSFLEDRVFSLDTTTAKDLLSIINTNTKMEIVCNRLYHISKNDSSTKDTFNFHLYQLLQSKNFYSCFVEILLFCVLEKKQPIYYESSVLETIENNLHYTNISLSEIHDFISMQLKEGIWSIRNIILLANKQNAFACFELASLEFYGAIAGYPRYNICYQYYKIAADKNHPVANWAIGFLYERGYIGNQSRQDYVKSFHYFNKARKLGCSSAFNSLGLALKQGYIPHLAKNEKKAENFFSIAANKKNVYAFNNLGLLYEEKHNYEKAFSYFSASADLEESWACNKVGEYYRKGLFVSKDLQKAFDYYTKASNSSIHTVCFWSYYNLAIYFYQNGCETIGIAKDPEKSILLLETASSKLIEASIALLELYYSEYLKSNKKNKVWLPKIDKQIQIIEQHPSYDKKLGKKIEKIMTTIHDTYQITYKK